MPPIKAARSLRALDGLVFFLADVQDGLGPYLSIYLLVHCAWEPSQVGVAMAAMVIGTLLAQLPAGALIDRTHRKRWVVVTAAGVVAASCIGMSLMHALPGIVVAQAMIGAAAAVMPPAIAGISLGLVGRAHFARRTGRNEALNHSGNVTAAVLSGVVGTVFGYIAIFHLVAAVALASAVCCLLIRESDIDHARAREAPEQPSNADAPTGSAIAVLWRTPRLMAFIAAMFLFHLGNAAMLPLVGQKVSIGKPDSAAALISACIVVAQVVMVPVALLAAHGAERWGRKPVFLIAFLVLPIRGLLYTQSVNPAFLIAVQVLDGIGAGIYGVVAVLMVADLARGTGRFNLALGATALALGLGTACSNLLAGVIASATSYNTTFATLSGIAASGLLWFLLAVPETRAQAEAAA